MEEDPITKLFHSEDGVVLNILSYVAPKDAGEAFKEASNLLEASNRLWKLFMQHLRTIPLSLYYGGEEPDEFYEPLARWTRDHNIRVDRLKADISVVHMNGFVECMTGINFSALKYLSLQLRNRNWQFSTGLVDSVYDLVTKPSLQELELYDMSETENYVALLGIQGLKKVTLQLCPNFSRALEIIESLPNIEYLKLWKGFGTSLSSSSLKILDNVDCFDVRFQQLHCPSLEKILCSNDCSVGPMPIISVIDDYEEETVSNPEEQPEATSKVVLPASAAMTNHDNFQIGEDCKIEVYIFEDETLPFL